MINSLLLLSLTNPSGITLLLLVALVVVVVFAILGYINNAVKYLAISVILLAILLLANYGGYFK